MSAQRGRREDRRCDCCGGLFQPRVADLNRGWGRYCSKSCKAAKQAANLEPVLVTAGDEFDFGNGIDQDEAA